MNVKLVTDAPAPTEPITELHIWIARTRDGGEGLLSGDIDLGFGRRNAPLMSTKRATAESLRQQAEFTRDMAAKAGMFIEIELRTFILKPSGN